MEKSKTNISYDEVNDILYIYKEGNVKGNIKIGNFVVDITSKGDVIGLEILDVTKTLPNFSKDILKSAKSAKLIIATKGDSVIITFCLISDIRPEKEMTIVIPSISEPREKEIELM